MRKINLTYMLALGIAVAFTSCTKKGDTGPAGATGPAGPTYTGAISGHISLFDQYGSKVLTGLGNTQLSLSGGAPVAADAAGYYIFGGTKTGSYTISATNSGYADTRLNNFQFLADTLNRDIKLSAIPNFSPTAVTVYTMAGGTGDSVVMTFATDSRVRNCILFLNSTSTVNNMPANYLLSYSRSIGANVPRAVLLIPKQDLLNAGLTSGANVYYAAYGYAVSDASSYEDLGTGKTVYTAVSASSMTGTGIVP